MILGLILGMLKKCWKPSLKNGKNEILMEKQLIILKRILEEDYYSGLFYRVLNEKGYKLLYPTFPVDHMIVTRRDKDQDKELTAYEYALLYDDFWAALPDNPCIRGQVFFDLCDYINENGYLKD